MSYRGVIGNALPLHVQFKVWRSTTAGANVFFFFLGRFVLSFLFVFSFFDRLNCKFTVFPRIIGTLRYEDGELGLRWGWMSKTRSSPVVSAPKKKNT